MTGTNSINGDAKVILLRLKNLEESQRVGFERVEKKIDDISDKFHEVDKQASENKTNIKNACHDSLYKIFFISSIFASSAWMRCSNSFNSSMSSDITSPSRSKSSIRSNSGFAHAGMSPGIGGS